MYIARYVLVPEPASVLERRMAELEEFCVQAEMDEIMFFIMPENYNRGQWRRNDYMPWLEVATQAKERIEAMGLRTSINPWHTILHCDRGRRSEDLDYRRMVLDTGYQCLSVACPLCENFQRMFFDMFCDCAKAGFQTIWVEDDYRFHNHNAPRGWGGCFCDEHMRRFKQHGMQADTREQLIANLNAEGIVHPDRTIWIEFMRESFLTMARDLRAEIDAIDPQVRLGLMTSRIHQHCLEGRDWEKLIDAFGGPRRVPVRPHAITYFESIREEPLDFMGNLSMTHSVISEGCQSFFEIDATSMSRYANSLSFVRMQSAFAVDGGCDELTLMLLDFLGHGRKSYPELSDMLRRQKPALLKLRETVKGTTPRGINCLLPIDTPLIAPGEDGESITGIPNIHYGWFVYLQAFGYPCQNVSQYDSREEFFAIAGKSAWAIEKDVLKDLLTRKTVLLDPIAADVVVKRGMGDWIGLDSVSFYSRGSSSFSYHQVCHSSADEIPIRVCIHNYEEDPDYQAATFNVAHSAEIQTELYDCFQNKMGAATYIHRNRTGGQVLVIPSTLPMPGSMYNRIHKDCLDDWMTQIGVTEKLPALVNTAWMYITVRQQSDKVTVFLTNLIFEFYEQFEIRLPEKLACMNWTPLLHSRDQEIHLKKKAHTLVVQTPMAGCDWMVLEGRHDYRK